MMAAMRTTPTFDDDVATKRRELAQPRGLTR
jgi:hypothetical protein